MKLINLAVGRWFDWFTIVTLKRRFFCHQESHKTESIFWYELIFECSGFKLRCQAVGSTSRRIRYRLQNSLKNSKRSHFQLAFRRWDTSTLVFY